MNPYQLCESIGLTWANYSCMASGKVVQCVSAGHLEAILKAGVVLYGDRLSDSDQIYTGRIEPRDTKSGLLINIRPIEKLEVVSKTEIMDLMDKMAKHIETIGLEMTPLYNDLRNRIEKAGIK